MRKALRACSTVLLRSALAIVKRAEQIAERVLVVAQARIIVRHGHGEVPRQLALDEARALQLLKPRQIVDAIQPEMVEEARRRAVGDRAPRRTATSAQTHPAGFQQDVERALG